MRACSIKLSYLIVLLSSVFFSSHAADNKSDEHVLFTEKIERAIIKFETTQPEYWSYNISRYENEEGEVTSSIEQYNPLSAEPWLLKQVNGITPSTEQAKQFSQQKRDQENSRKESGNIKLKLRELINQQSLFLVSNNESTIVMRFSVELKKLGKDAIGKLQGELIYRKDDAFIETITIWNKAPFSPMFTANITDLKIIFTFTHIDGAVLTKKNEMQMKGTFAYFTEINETSLDAFSDYKYQGQEH